MEAPLRPVHPDPVPRLARVSRRRDEALKAIGGDRVLARVCSGAVVGIEAIEVRVEVDLGNGLPGIALVGLPESAVREGRERVSAALSNSGFPIPPKRITVNLAPADVRKVGSAFDLPIALGLLAAMQVVPLDRLDGVCAVGELGLDGELRPVRGVLPVADLCRSAGMRELIVPRANGAEAAVVVPDAVRAAPDLASVVRYLRGQPMDGVAAGSAGGEAADRVLAPPAAAEAAEPLPDLADVKGQDFARRALEIAAAGAHNLLMIGPPGAGKSMLARRIPGILPPLGRAAAIEVTKIHSVAGRLRAGQALVAEPPFRAPHHGISDAGLIGGGSMPRPGEVSLAHHGVLFLDELGEFRRGVLEAMRQVLEDGWLQIGRARGSTRFPARFVLVAAMNPCPCGWHGDARDRCTCPEALVERYRSRISGPLLDRIDLHVEVPALTPDELVGRGSGESSRVVRDRVLAARERQSDRTGGAGRPNAQLRPREVRDHCRLDPAGEALLRTAVHRLGLSGRAYDRVLKVARTVADLDAAGRISATHLGEAIQYRALDRRIPAVR